MMTNTTIADEIAFARSLATTYEITDKSTHAINQLNVYTLL